MHHDHGPCDDSGLETPGLPAADEPTAPDIALADFDADLNEEGEAS